jgi:hypothetical protein
VDSLRAQLQRFETQRPLRDTAPISTGCQELDRVLPRHGIARGSLIECLGLELQLELSPADSPPHSWQAQGAGTLAIILARQAALEGGAIVVLDHQHDFYPPAAAVLGVDLEELIVVRAQRQEDQVWAADQALRCPGVAAVWAPFEQLDEHAFRRLQIAAEQGGGLGLLIRSQKVRRQPSWADLQLLIETQVVGANQLRRGRRLRIELARCRQGRSGGVVEVEIDEVTGAMQQVSSQHETPTLYPAAQLAHPASRGRSARA